MKYEWDPKKRISNLEKHHIDFIDSIPIFEDENAITIEIDHEIYKEKRFVTIGKDPEERILTVVYTLRGHNIRIISARTASKSERKQYFGDKP